MKLTTQHISLIISLILCLILGLSLGNSCNNSYQKSEIIRRYEDSIRVNKILLQQKQEELEVLEKDLINSLNTYNDLQKKYKRLKNSINEKVDSVGNLDNHSSYLFISKWLSERNNIERR